MILPRMALVTTVSGYVFFGTILGGGAQASMAARRSGFSQMRTPGTRFDTNDVLTTAPFS